MTSWYGINHNREHSCHKELQFDKWDKELPNISKSSTAVYEPDLAWADGMAFIPSLILNRQSSTNKGSDFSFWVASNSIAYFIGAWRGRGKSRQLPCTYRGMPSCGGVLDIKIFGMGGVPSTLGKISRENSRTSSSPSPMLWGRARVTFKQ